MSLVLQAMHVDPDDGLGAIRFSLGRTTTESDLQYVVEQLAHSLEQERA
jgi:cysteine desulfurase